MTAIKDKINQVVGKINSLRIVEKEFSSVEDRKKQLTAGQFKLLRELEKKNNEISGLEKFSVGRLIKSVFIDRKKVLEQKREEYYQLSKRYDKLKSEIAALDYELSILEKKYNELLKYRQELEALYEKREDELLQEDSSDGLAYRNIVDEIGELENKKTKLLITNSLSDKLEGKLTLLSAALREVEGYGNWKNRRRMRRANSYKNTAIRNAKQYLLESNLLIKKLQQSIDDIGLEAPALNLKPVEFQSFVNILFDNFITDIILRKKLNDAVENVEDVFQNLNYIKRQLKNKLGNLDKKIKRLELVKKDIVSKIQ